MGAGAAGAGGEGLAVTAVGPQASVPVGAAISPGVGTAAMLGGEDEERFMPDGAGWRR